MNAKEKMRKYYEERPFYEEYRGWIIRTHKTESKYLGTILNYVCDVRPGVESIMGSNVESVKKWIDQKIKEGKTQQEDI